MITATVVVCLAVILTVPITVFYSVKMAVVAYYSGLRQVEKEKQYG